MKKVYLLTILLPVLFACNDDSDSHSSASDKDNHMGHDMPANHSADSTGEDPITATMTGMMQTMHTLKPTGNNDVDFAAMMLEHHKAAVAMADIEIAKGNNEELKTFAQTVTNDQNKEISFMKEFLEAGSKTPSANSADFQKAMDQSMMGMMNSNAVIYHNIDKDFAAQMIPHHQSAVDMAKAYLAYGNEKTLTTLCQSIINSQTKEINWLKQWLLKNK